VIAIGLLQIDLDPVDLAAEIVVRRTVIGRETVAALGQAAASYLNSMRSWSLAGMGVVPSV
jgi:hypothetical protein